ARRHEVRGLHARRVRCGEGGTAQAGLVSPTRTQHLDREPDGLDRAGVVGGVPAHGTGGRPRDVALPCRTPPLSVGGPDGDRVVLEEIRAKHKGLAQIGYDPWNANHLASSLVAAGVQMVEVRQGYASLSGPSKLLEALVRSRRIRHDGNPVMRWCVANCEVAS